MQSSYNVGNGFKPFVIPKKLTPLFLLVGVTAPYPISILIRIKMQSAKQWFSSPIVIKLYPGALAEADPKPITFTYQPLATDKALKVNMKIAEWWSNGTEHTSEVESESHSVLGATLEYYARRVSVEKVIIDHRGLKTIMKKKETLLWLQNDRKLTKVIVEGAESEDVENYGEDLDLDTYVTDYDWYKKILDRFEQLVNQITSQCNWLHWEGVLAGKDCPVLLEPLEPNRTYRLKCDHYISQEAWMKLKGPMQCPLCRADATTPYMCGINR